MTRLRQNDSFSKVFRVMVWVALYVPFFVYIFYIFRYSINVPLADDYDAVLRFMNSFENGDLAEKLRLLFSQHNEHRIFFDRIVFVLQKFIFGEINFRYLILFGNFGWILAVCGLIFVCKKTLNLPMVYLLPLPYFLLSFTHWTNMFFAMASIQNYWFLFFALIFLLCLSQNRLIKSCLFFLVALFTSGGGIVLYPLGNFYWLLRKEWRRFWLFGAFSTISMLAYFYHYHRPSHHPSIMGALSNFEQVVEYFLVFWGALIPKRELSLLIGFVVFSLAVILLVMKRAKSNFPYLVLGFTSLVALSASVTRSSFGIEQALESKYAMYPLLNMVFVYLLLLIQAREARISRELLGLLGAFIPLSFCVFFGFLLKYEVSDFFSLLQMERIAKLSSRSESSIVLASEKLGIYNYRDAPFHSPEKLPYDAIDSNVDFEGHINTYDDFRVSGWAFIPNLSAANSNISVLLKGKWGIFRLDTLRVYRFDIPKAYNNMFQYEACGYHCFIGAYNLPPGHYEIGILVENGDKKAVRWSDMIYTVSKTLDLLPLYQWGDSVTVDSPQAIFTGWHTPEAEGTWIWSKGEFADVTLKISMEQLSQHQDFVLEIDAATYHTQTVEIQVNGTAVGTFEGQVSNIYQFPVPAAVLSAGVEQQDDLFILIRFVTPDSLSPATVNPGNGDQRILGVGLHEFKLYPVSK